MNKIMTWPPKSSDLSLNLYGINWIGEFEENS